MHDAKALVRPEFHHRGRPTRGCSAPSSSISGRCVYGGIYEPGHPDGRRATGSAATCWRWCASWRRRSCAIRAATSSPAMIGRTASGRSRSGRAGSTSRGCRRSRTRSAPTSSSIGAARPTSSRCWRSTSARAAGDAARRLVEYCNHPGGTALSDLRREHGWEQPHDMKFWCLGNEMDGPWQMERQDRGGIRPHRGRGREDDALDRSDRSSSRACGSSGRNMPTFGELGRRGAASTPSTMSTSSRCTRI